MNSNQNNEVTLPFRPRARLLQLLGDQLIGSARLAVFELVKNAYDADAELVLITLKNINTPQATITIEDDGEGMSLDIIRNIWLVPAHDHKEKQKQEKRRTKLKRLPLGEKGLGRFAVHKLGEKIELVTRAKDQPECVVIIDWKDFLENSFLSDANVVVNTRLPLVFLGESTGTQIRISNLRETEWTRGEVRRLLRQITSISTPFPEKRIDTFETILQVIGHEDWVSGIPDIDILKKRAPWHFKFEIIDGLIKWSYQFRGVVGLKVEPRNIFQDFTKLTLPPKPRDSDDDPKPEKIIADANYMSGIGNIKGEFFVFDRDREVLEKLGEQNLIQSFLDEQGGIRVYRDNIRVYNYGEQGDDWLGLDLRRVNIPGRNISRNIVIGTVDLSVEDSYSLIEKTNREGFIENEAFNRFRKLVLGALSQLEFERKQDKDRIRSVTGNASDLVVENVSKPLESIRDIAKKHKILEEINPILIRAEKNYNDMQEVMLKAGFSGMGLAVVFHQIEQGVKTLFKSIEKSANIDFIRDQAKELVVILDSFAGLLRQGDKKPLGLKLAIKRMRDMNKVRLREHKIKFICPFLEEDKKDFEHSYILNLMLGILNNLLDNSIYWLQVRWPNNIINERKIYIDFIEDFDGYPAIIFADNGTGFQDSPEQLVKPFFSRRPNGMGIGLYYCNIAMELNGGRLVILDNNDSDLPDGFDGASIALVLDKGI